MGFWAVHLQCTWILDFKQERTFFDYVYLKSNTNVISLFIAVRIGLDQSFIAGGMCTPGVRKRECQVALEALLSLADEERKRVWRLTSKCKVT